MLLLMLIFPLQSALEIINDRRINVFDEVVYKATQTARTDGYFKQSTIDQLRNDLKTAFPDLSDTEITANVTTTPKYRLNQFDSRETINYEISIPIKRIMVAPAILGISDTDNQYVSKKKGYVLSEVLLK